VYAYDAARSDGILVIHDLLATHGVAPDDLTFSSGKAMKFTWNGLTFVDICLITQCSLAQACDAFDVDPELTKGRTATFRAVLLTRCSFRSGILCVMCSMHHCDLMGHRIVFIVVATPAVCGHNAA
jgi:hypothetical protein